MSLQTWLVSTGLVNAIVLFLALNAVKGKSKKPARYLGVFILAYFITLFNWVIAPLIGSHLNLLLPWIPVIFFLPAFAFFFFQSISNPTFRVKGKHIYLLLPGLLDVLYQLIRYVYYAINNGFEYSFLMNRGPQYFIHDGLAIINTVAVFLLILQHIRKIPYVEDPHKKFYKVFIFFLGYMLVRWSSFYLVDLFKPSLLNNQLFIFAWVIEMVGLLIVGYKGLIDTSLFNIRLNRKSTVKRNELKQLATELLEVLSNQKLYLKNDLSRKELASALNTTEVNISHVLNQGLSTSFYTLINEMRVTEVAKLIDQGQHENYTLEALAKNAGFNSLTTFNKAFKEKFGVTASGYIKKSNI